MLTRLSILWNRHFKRILRKTRGSTLIETVVSMTILLFIITLFFTRIDRINGSLDPHDLYRAYQVTSLVLQQDDLLVETGRDETIDGFTVKKQVEKMNGSLYRVSLEVFDRKGRSVYTRNKLISPRIEI